MPSTQQSPLRRIALGLALLCALVLLVGPATALADPAAPTIAVAGAPTVRSGDGITLTGTGEPGAHIEIVDADGSRGTAIVEDNGTWVADISAYDGDNALSAEQTVGGDPAGTAGPVHVFGVYAPIVTTPALGVHVPRTFSVSGFGIAGAAVRIADGNDVELATATVDGLGHFSAHVTMAYGVGSIAVTQTFDGVGASDVLDVDVRPAPPTVDSPVEGQQVNQGFIHVTGTADPGATVNVEVQGVATYTGTADEDGDFDVRVLASWGYPRLVVTQTVDGVDGDANGILQIETNTAYPTLSYTGATTLVSGATVALSGTGYPGEHLHIDEFYVPVDGTDMTVAADGTWSTSVTVGDWDNYFSVVNDDGWRADVYILGVGAPTTQYPVDHDAVASTFETYAYGLAGAAFTLKDESGTVLGTATANEYGIAVFTTTTPLAAGDHTLHLAQTINGVTGADQLIDVTVMEPPTIEGPTVPVAPGTVHITGTATPGATVKIKDYYDEIGTGTADATTGHFDIPVTLDARSHAISATQTIGGHTSPATETFWVDVEAPAPTLDITGHPTKVAGGSALALTGTGAAGAELEIWRNSDLVGTVTVASDGTWSKSVDAGDDPDTYLYAYDTTNFNSSEQSYVQVVPRPFVTSPAEGAAVLPSFTVTGYGTPSVTVRIRDENGTQIGSRNPGVCGCFSININGTLSNGAHTLNVTQVVSGTTVTRVVHITVDPHALTLNSPSQGQTVGVGPVHFTGSGHVGGTIKVYRDDTTGTPVGTGTVDGSGNFDVTATVTGTIGDSAYLYVTETVGGVTSTPIATYVWLGLGSPTISTSSYYADADGTVVLSGTGVPGATVTIVRNSTNVATTTVAGDGTWSKTVTVAYWDNYFSAYQTVSGSNSPAVDLSQVVEGIGAPNVSSPASGEAMNVSNYMFQGDTTPIGGVVEIRDEGGALLATATVGSTFGVDAGLWSQVVPGALPLAPGAHTLHFRQVIGGFSGPETLVPVTVPLAAPGITSPQSQSPPAHVTGTSNANATITIYTSGTNTVVGTGTANGSGTWDVALSSLGVGNYSFDVTQTVGGLESPRTAIVVNVLNPAPAITSVTPTTVKINSTIVVTGTSQPNAAIIVFRNNGSWGFGTANASGNWTVTTSGWTRSGSTTDWTVNAMQTVGGVDSALSPDVHVTSVDALTITSPSATGGTSGSVTFGGARGTPTAAVTVTDENGTTLGTTTVAAGGTWSVPTTLTTGAHTIHATQTINGVTSTDTTKTYGVGPAPTISQSPPATLTAAQNQSVTFTAAATSALPITGIQWARTTSGGSTYTNITGATSASYTFTTASGDNNRRYRATFTNAAGATTSGNVLLTVNSNVWPSITTQPTAQSANAGSSATFSSAGSGTPSPGRQWERSTDGGTTWTPIATGGTGSNYTTPVTTAADDGTRFHVIYSNTAGSTTSSAVALTVRYAPIVGTQPATQTVNAGQLASFTAAATGQPAATIQWQSSPDGTNWTNLVGSTSGTLAFTTSAIHDGMRYRAAFTNSQGTTNSNAATLTVRYAPVVGTQPATQTVNAGQLATFTAASTGTPTPTVQWQRSPDGTNWTDVTGATSGTYSFTPTAADDGAKLRAVFTNTQGSTNSNAATLTVNYAPVIGTQPGDQTVDLGQTATFTSAATGKPTPTVKWQRSPDGTNWTDVSGATSASYSFAPIASDAGARFRAVYTNARGSTNTNGATLTVRAAPALVALPRIERAEAPLVGTKLGIDAGAWTGSPTSMTYQWLRCDLLGSSCASITGETRSTYTPAVADAGHTLRIQVVAINATGSSVPAISAPSGMVTGVGLPVPVVIDAPRIERGSSPVVGTELGTSVGSWSYSPVSYGFQWVRCDANGSSGCSDIAGATRSTYTPVLADAGRTLRIRVTGINGGGASLPATTAPSGLVTGGGLPIPVSTDAPRIERATAPVVGTELGVYGGNWSNSPISYGFQWVRCDVNGANCADVAGATRSTYTPDVGDAGRTLRIRVTAINAGGSSLPATSAASGMVTGGVPVPALTDAPRIERGSNPVVGTDIGVYTGSWTGSPLSYAFQWVRCDADGSSNCADISGATRSVYTPVLADAGRTLRVRVTALNIGGSSLPATSAPSGMVTGGGLPIPVSTDAPRIERATAPLVGTELGAYGGAWSNSPVSYSFQWVRCDVDGASNCADIGGATHSTYTPVVADAGRTLKIRVVALNAGGSSLPATSAASGMVTGGVPVPAVTDAPRIERASAPVVGTKLGLYAGTWSNSPLLMAFQWVACDADGVSNCADIPGRTASTYTPAVGDVGRTLRVRVTATNAGGPSAPATSAPSGVVSST